MNLIHEQVRHDQFGIGSIIEQADKIISVKFSDEYGIKSFQDPLAFDKYLILCNDDLQDKIRDEARLVTEQVQAERKHKEEEEKRQEEERIKNLASKQTVPKKRAPAKSATQKASPKSKKPALPLTHNLLRGRDDLSDAFLIRRKVFMEEQGVSEAIELDSLDQTSEHIVIYGEARPIGTGRLLVEDGMVLIGRVAVLKQYRSQKIGSKVVNQLRAKAFENGATEVHLHAQKAVQGFYEKLGFEAYGEDFEEAGILHISMKSVKSEAQKIKCKQALKDSGKPLSFNIKMEFLHK